MRANGICLVQREVTGDTVLNVMPGIRYAKDKMAESKENNRAKIEATKEADISKQMTLWEATVEKIEAIQDN